jgi:hypothetical protein
MRSHVAWTGKYSRALPNHAAAATVSFSPSSRLRPRKARYWPGSGSLSYCYCNITWRMRPKTPVVKDLPRSLVGFASPDSPGHVFAADPTEEGRQEAYLLERRREPASCWRPRGAAPPLYLGEISPSQATAWRKSIEVSTRTPGIRGHWRSSPRIAPASAGQSSGTTAAFMSLMSHRPLTRIKVSSEFVCAPKPFSYGCGHRLGNFIQSTT